MQNYSTLVYVQEEENIFTLRKFDDGVVKLYQNEQELSDLEAEEKTIGGIIIPDSAKEKPLKGEVISAGKGTKDEEMVIKVGDTVLYGKYAGTELDLDGVKYLIMRQSDVLAILG